MSKKVRIKPANMFGNITSTKANLPYSYTVSYSSFGQHITANTYEIDDQYSFYFEDNNTDNVASDIVSFSVASGTYYYTFFTAKNTSLAILEVYIDGVLDYTTDTYAVAVGTELHTNSIYLSPGNHTIQFKINGRNASSTGYNILFLNYEVNFTRISD